MEAVQKKYTEFYEGLLTYELLNVGNKEQCCEIRNDVQEKFGYIDETEEIINYVKENILYC